jgi:hypothetical protein
MSMKIAEGWHSRIYRHQMSDPAEPGPSKAPALPRNRLVETPPFHKAGCGGIKSRMYSIPAPMCLGGIPDSKNLTEGLGAALAYLDHQTFSNPEVLP